MLMLLQQLRHRNTQIVIILQMQHLLTIQYTLATLDHELTQMGLVWALVVANSLMEMNTNQK